MMTGYQVYMRRKNEKCFHDCGVINWSWKEEDAIERCAKLNDTWKDFGYEYIVVKLG